MTDNSNPNSTPVTFLESEKVYDGFFKMLRLKLRYEEFNGTESETLIREIFERGSAAAVLLYDAKLDRVKVIRQFLPGAHMAGVDNRPVQIVAGMVEKGETPEGVACREASEEAGADITHVEHLRSFLVSPGGSSEMVHCFVAPHDCSGELGPQGIHGVATEHENIRAEIYTADEIIEMLDNGEILAGPAVVALDVFARKRPAIRKRWLDEGTA